jgi:hypothetical protein
MVLVLRERLSAITSRAGIWGVGRSSRDQFFRISHTKIDEQPIFQLLRTNFDQNFQFLVQAGIKIGQKRR